MAIQEVCIACITRRQAVESRKHGWTELPVILKYSASPIPRSENSLANGNTPDD
jgi:hypothetical protein